MLGPTVFVVDRIHPNRRDRTWPGLVPSRRIALYEIATHALFGLGTLVCRRPGTATIIVP